MAILEERVSDILKKVEIISNESQTLTESSKIVKEAHKLLYDLKGKMEKMTSDAKKIEKKMEAKIDHDEFFKALANKCD
jgi:Holliday junction resolvasome RuvABC DNA-binding subunit